MDERQEPRLINVGRRHSGGVCNGIFGNPLKEKVVGPHYKPYVRAILKSYPQEREWLIEQLKQGAKLSCPGCGVDSPTCHARILENELAKYITF